MFKKALLIVCVIMLLTPTVALASIPGPATCSPGFWKQEQHFWAWEPSGVQPGDMFNADMTYLRALQGGFATRETRFIVAEFLNSFWSADNSPCPDEIE